MTDTIRVTHGMAGNVWNIDYGRGPGTAFLWGDDAGTFFVTVQHIVKGARAGDVFHFQHRSGPRSINIAEIHHSATNDVSVFTTRDIKSSETKFSTSGNIALAQRVIFLGFPHGPYNDSPDLVVFPAMTSFRCR